MVKETELKLAELRGFTRALAIFMTLSWFLLVLVVAYLLQQINLIPNKDAEQIQNILNKYQVTIH